MHIVNMTSAAKKGGIEGLEKELEEIFNDIMPIREERKNPIITKEIEGAFE